MNRLLSLFFILLPIATAHVISMSTGDAQVRGSRIEYILRMPQYEVRSGVDATNGLLSRLHFRANGETAKQLDGECHLEPSQGQYLCAADYAFSAATSGDIDVDCTFFQVTSPNHVHMLRAKRGDKFDQAILDSTFSTASLTFRPPTKGEIAAAQMSAGAFRTLSSIAQVLLLCALGFSVRNRRDAVFIILAFSTAECFTAYTLFRTAWQASPQFTEAAVALALAYLAVELLFWPDAGGRWLLALLFGAFSGMYFSSFLRESGFRPAYVLSGSVLVAATLAAVCAAIRWKLGKQTSISPRFVGMAGRTAAVGLLASGAIWFVIRIRF